MPCSSAYINRYLYFCFIRRERQTWPMKFVNRNCRLGNRQVEQRLVVGEAAQVLHCFSALFVRVAVRVS